AADQYGPAIAFDPAEIILYKGGSTVMTGCVDAMAGTTVTASWANSDPDLGMAWTDFATGVEVETGAIEIDFTAPDELTGYQGMIRIVATDPMDRSYTGFHTTLVTVLEAEDPGSCADTGSFIGMPGCA